jgi:hypothetical protein
MILDWQKKRPHSQDWQAILWRELVKGNEHAHHAALLQAFLKDPQTFCAAGEFAGADRRLRNLRPSAVSYPGPGRGLSFIDVHLFLMNPCQEYWGDIVSGREMMKVVEHEKRPDLRKTCTWKEETACSPRRNARPGFLEADYRPGRKSILYSRSRGKKPPLDDSGRYPEPPGPGKEGSEKEKNQPG